MNQIPGLEILKMEWLDDLNKYEELLPTVPEEMKVELISHIKLCKRQIEILESAIEGLRNGG